MLANRNVQYGIMLLLTLVMGYLFIRQVPDPEEVTRLKREIASYQTALALYQNPPTGTPTSIFAVSNGTPTVAPVTTQEPAPPGITQTPAFQTPIVISTPITQNNSALTLTPYILPSLPSGAQVLSIQLSTQIDQQGCAISPQAVFTPFDTIYGVGQFININQDDQIVTRFQEKTTGAVIAEDFFTVNEGGNFCRWYSIVPDEIGWTPGVYTLSYQINDNPPVTAEYTITGEVMNDQ